MPQVIKTVIKTCECWNCDSLIEYKPSETFLVTLDNGKIAPKVTRRYLTCPCCKIDIEIVKELICNGVLNVNKSKLSHAGLLGIL